MVSGIEKRAELEKKVDQTPQPQNVKFSEFKELKFADDEKVLFDRLLRARALQMETGKKLDNNSLDLFMQRINKRRLAHEQELLGHNTKERQQIILSYALKSIASALDSQTNYFTPAEANQFLIQVQQRLFGIGAQLRDDINGLSIVRLVEGSPAIKTGKLRMGDKIIAVDHQSIVGLDITEAVELIRGQAGTSVTLTILRETDEQELKKDEKIDIEIVRGEVVMKDTRFEAFTEPFGDGVIGILHLFSFYQDSKTSSASDLLHAINDFKTQHNLKGIILDLRSNAGGLLSQAVSVTGLFIAKGVVVSVKDNTGLVQHLRNIEGKTAWDGPLMVLTNRASASAAEIVAQTLQDYGKAIVVGDPTTYGKGTFQTFTLEAAHYGKVNPKGEFKVTRGRYYTVSGKSPQLTGVSADIVVPGVFFTAEVGEKYSKHPLDTDQIEPSFQDTLDDIPFHQRAKISELYRFNLQPVVTTYQPYLPVLKQNTESRQKSNKNYVNFVKEISKTDSDGEFNENFGQNDLQLSETINVMKDLILLEQKTERKSA